MKYSSVGHTKVKTFKVRNFKGGIDNSAPNFSIADNALSSALNMQYKNGVLKTRNGLFAAADSVIKNENPDTYNTFSYRVTDNEVYINGEKKKIAIEEYCMSGSHYFCYIYFVGEDGTVTPASYLLFNRTTSTLFHNPENMLFFSGKPNSGAGIYVFVTTADLYNYSNKDYMIYELSSDLNEWQRVYNYYTPVIYINGRGTRYEEAKATGLAFTGAPKVLESQNMLTSRFKAYFTSDGHSSSFRLPLTGIAEESVICRIYKNPTSYTEWCIMPGTASDTQTFYTAEITLNIDREKGILNFTDAEGDYPVPMMNMYHENNICITAGKEIANSFENVVSSTCLSYYNSKIIFSGSKNKGSIISVSVDNPLYFPVDSVGTVGDDKSDVTALLSYKDGIIAFKENSIYLLTVKNGEVLNSNSLLSDDDSYFYKGDIFSAKALSGQIGCKNKRTAVLCGKVPIWLGSDKKIYSLNISSNEINCISNKISSYLEELNDYEILEAFSVCNLDTYSLIIGNKAFVTDFYNKDIKNGSFNLWNFGDINILGAIEGKNGLRYFCKGSDGSVFYTAVLSGEKDTDICGNGQEVTINSKAFESNITTKCFDFGSGVTNKIIENIFLSLSSAGKIEISVNNRYFDTVSLGIPDLDYTCGTLKSVKLIPHLAGVNSICITLSSVSGFTVGELMIYYREAV